VLHRDEKKHPNELTVKVMAQQFTWTFQYQKPGGGVLTTPSLYLPVNRPTHFDIYARDVIHAFYVPAFRIQEDAVPGQTDHARATPNKVGTYELVCAELCGLGHSTMRSAVYVMPQAQFDSWLRTAGASSAGSSTKGGSTTSTTTATPALGKQVFTSATAGCGACHTIADAGTSGTIGPQLDRFLRGKSPSYIRTQIIKPDTYRVPGFPAGVMPRDFAKRLTPTQLNALVAYLSQVSGGKR
jgi:cytochrome c oxidase subunit 2